MTLRQGYSLLKTKFHCRRTHYIVLQSNILKTIKVDNHLYTHIINILTYKHPIYYYIITQP